MNRGMGATAPPMSTQSKIICACGGDLVVIGADEFITDPSAAIGRMVEASCSKCSKSTKLRIGQMGPGR